MASLEVPALKTPAQNTGHLVGMGPDDAREFGDEFRPKDRPILRGCIQDFRNLIQVPSQGEESLIRAGQSLQFCLTHMRRSGEPSTQHRHHPFRRHIAFVTGERSQGDELGWRHIQFYTGGGSFSPLEDARPRRRRLSRRLVHGLPKDLPQRMARRHLVLLTPGEPGSFQLTQIHCDCRRAFRGHAYQAKYIATSPMPQRALAVSGRMSSRWMVGSGSRSPRRFGTVFSRAV